MEKPTLATIDPVEKALVRWLKRLYHWRRRNGAAGPQLEILLRERPLWFKTTITKDACIAEAKKFKKRVEWFRGSSVLARSTYGRARKEGWLEECCAHMKTHVPLTKQECQKDALRFQTRKEWRQKSLPFYSRAHNRKWLGDCCSHMTALRINYSKAECLSDAKAFNRPSHWRRASKRSRNLYAIAHKKGWLSECCAHMEVKRNWTKTELKTALEMKTQGKTLAQIAKALDRSMSTVWINMKGRHEKESTSVVPERGPAHSIPARKKDSD